MENLMKILPPEIMQYLEKIQASYITEIRLRVNQKLRIRLLDKEKVFEYVVKSQDMTEILKRVSNNSIYSIQDNINSGYITA